MYDKEWSCYANTAAMIINTSHSSIIGASPFEITHGFQLRTMLQHVMDVGIDEEQKNLNEIKKTYIIRTRKLVEEAKKLQSKAKEEAEKTFENKRGEVHEWMIGEAVMI